MIKNIITITGIRPDFIRMSNIFKLLDDSPIINHILIHTGQHTDNLLSDVFFKDLNIRKPDYLLSTRDYGNEHYDQLSYLSKNLIDLIKNNKLNPDLIIFLGDSNSACVSLPLRKEGYNIAHIEAGMRSYDKRMLEEINRTVCDHCSHHLFVYHEDYKTNLIKENIKHNIHVVGNTIKEVGTKIINDYDIMKYPKTNDKILLDIHRPENFKYKDRMIKIIDYANKISDAYNIPIYMLDFLRTTTNLKKFDINLRNIKLIPMMNYIDYMNFIYNCKFIISDSGTAQEEPTLIKTPVIVPRDYTERPQSVDMNCSFMLYLNTKTYYDDSVSWINNHNGEFCTEWLGDGNTAYNIVKIIENL